ncbi:DUF6082 family protein [Streptomyces pratens]|uniref:DUF6082 family protein n=1 Tax=Streptomyces pratens TaxID=887456 RepID=A0ABW1M8D6_9ACTN
MRTPQAILVATAVGAAGIWLAERRHRQRIALDAAEIHQRLLADIATDPEQRAAWATDGLSPEAYAKSVHCNRLISFLSVKFRVGLLDRAALRVQARSIMARGETRAYWARFGAFREEEALDGIDRTFNRILDDAYSAAADGTVPVTA